MGRKKYEHEARIYEYEERPSLPILRQTLPYVSAPFFPKRWSMSK